MNQLAAYDKSQLSPTSTLSSGYESGCIESEIDDILCFGNTQESIYFDLESDQYVCLDSTPENTDKLKQVRESMIKIIADLESLGFETNMDKLAQAVRSSVREKRCRRKREPAYTKSPVDELFTEIGHSDDSEYKDKLYDRLISNLASECSEEPIYEEINDLYGEDNDFDAVTHSGTHRRQAKPPALPPRRTQSDARRSTCPDLRTAVERTPFASTHSLTEVEKVMWQRNCKKSSSWKAIGEGCATRWQFL